MQNIYAQRRRQLAETIKEKYPNYVGKIIIFAAFEQEQYPFLQESSFYYLSGIEEPAIAMVIDLDGYTELYIPDYMVDRTHWMSDALTLSTQLPGIDAIKYLGNPQPGYQLHLFSPISCYADLIEEIKGTLFAHEKIFTLFPHNPHEYMFSRAILYKLNTQMAILLENIVDISGLIAQQRRTKDAHEIALIKQAIAITATAQQAAQAAIADNVNEAYVQSHLEAAMIGCGARVAFPSIVAAGQHSTVLHYHKNNNVMHAGDTVVVDIGARYNYYCADITRTYTVGNKRSARQQEIYNIVRDTQQYVASLAQAGWFINNRKYSEKSLYHQAKNYLARYGYEHYFIHGIGHYLGLDVHDVGSYEIALQPGDVFTIEPGIYIQQERLGVRIEDNYYIENSQAVCLSTMIPK